MKNPIASMIVSVIMGQPILAGPLSMDTMVVNGDPKLLGRFQSGWDRDGLRLTMEKHKYVSGPVMAANRTMVWGMFGGALAFSLLSWQQFDRASDYEAEATLNREHGQLSRAQKLDDKADSARLYGWSTAVLAAGSFGVGVTLISLKTTHPVFPELSFRDGEPHVGVSYVYSF